MLRKISIKGMKDKNLHERGTDPIMPSCSEGCCDYITAAVTQAYHIMQGHYLGL